MGYSLRKRNVDSTEPQNVKKMRVGRHRDTGLVSLTNPSSDTSAIFEINSVQSPLLRLPAELRNRIFAYALGGMDYLIKIKVDKGAKTLDRVRNELEELSIRPTTVPYGAIIDRVDGNLLAPIDQQAPVDILCTCRQIYMENWALLYEMNTFHFTSAARLRVWHAFRKQGQKDMVRTIKVDVDMVELIKGGQFGLQSLTVMFPKLKTLVVGDERTGYDDFFWTEDDVTDPFWRNADMVKEGEREDLEVLFESTMW